MAELLLALDCGTTSVRACLFSPEGKLLARSAAPIRSHSPAPGRVEQDAAAVWRSARAVLRRALAGRRAEAVAALGIATQRASLVIWDKQTGRPLTPLVIWSDLRGTERAAELQAAGFPLSAQQAAAKLEHALAEAEDASALAGAGRLAWGNVDSWLVWKLTGGLHVTDRSHAWPLGYLDLASFGWNTRLIEHQGLPRSAFPELVDTWGPLGRTAPAVLGAPIPLTATIADQQAAMVGQDAEAAGRGKVSYGTSAALDVSTGAQFTYRGPGSAPFVLSSVGGETRFALEGMVYTAGAALDWARRTMGLGSHARLERLAAQATDTSGVAFLPALQGLGAPYADMSRRGALIGLGQSTTQPQIARALLEGLAFRVREAFDHLYDTPGLTPPEVLPVDGGLTASDQLMQAQADILVRPVARHAAREATAAGAAVCAGRGAGLFGTAETPPGFAARDRTFEPRWSADQAAERLHAWRAQLHL